MLKVGILITGVAAVYLLRLNGAAGLMVDDAWYMLLAKALADGRGYRVISSAAGEMLPLYPPGLPAILSVIFRVHPDFPHNVMLLKSVSVAAMLGLAFLTYVYLHRDRNVQHGLAAGAAVAVALTPAFVFLATSTVMSECVFALGQLGAVVLLHRSVASPGSGRGSTLAIAAGVVAAAAVLVRSAGIGLVPAALLWLAKERHWRAAMLFASVAGLCLAPWMLYSRSHAPTAEQSAAHGGAIVYGYTDQFWMRWAGSPSFGRATAADIPARIGTNLVDVFGRDLGGIMLPSLFRGASESGEEVVALGGRAGLSAASMGGAVETMVISFLLSAVLLMGYIRKARERLTIAEFLVPISLVITLLWPFWSFRFVLPLTPFLFLYFVAGVQALARGSERVARIALLCVVGLHAYDHAGYVWRARTPDAVPSIPWIADARSVDAALAWMRDRLAGDDPIASTNPALVYLRTGRKGIAFDDPSVRFSTLKARGVRYVVSLLPVDLPSGSKGAYDVLYSAERLWVIELK